MHRLIQFKTPQPCQHSVYVSRSDMSNLSLQTPHRHGSGKLASSRIQAMSHLASRRWDRFQSGGALHIPVQLHRFQRPRGAPEPVEKKAGRPPGSRAEDDRCDSKRCETAVCEAPAAVSSGCCADSPVGKGAGRVTGQRTRGGHGEGGRQGRGRANRPFIRGEGRRRVALSATGGRAVVPRQLGISI